MKYTLNTLISLSFALLMMLLPASLEAAPGDTIVPLINQGNHTQQFQTLSVGQGSWVSTGQQSIGFDASGSNINTLFDDVSNIISIAGNFISQGNAFIGKVQNGSTSWSLPAPDRGTLALPTNVLNVDGSLLASSLANPDQRRLCTGSEGIIFLCEREIQAQWNISPWGQCNGNQKTRTVTCNRGAQVVDDVQCSSTPKPALTSSEGCTTYTWEEGDYGSCNDGQKTRTVRCKGSDDRYYQDSLCAQIQTKPVTTTSNGCELDQPDPIAPTLNTANYTAALFTLCSDGNAGQDREIEGFGFNGTNNQRDYNAVFDGTSVKTSFADNLDDAVKEFFGPNARPVRSGLRNNGNGIAAFFMETNGLTNTQPQLSNGSPDGSGTERYVIGVEEAAVYTTNVPNNRPRCPRGRTQANAVILEPNNTLNGFNVQSLQRDNPDYLFDLLHPIGWYIVKNN